MVHQFSLAGRTAVITGAASGIGAGIAEVLAEAGAFAIHADRDTNGARARAEALAERGLQADWIELDVASEASVNAACRQIVARHGAPWALVNNAGVQDRQYLFAENVDNWDRTFAVNARGPFLTTREFGRAMVERADGGRIVNIASASIAGMIVKGAAAYVSSKGALKAFSSIAALELVEHGITVNTVLPGAVATPGTMGAKGPPTIGPGTRRAPLGLSEPGDIGAAVLFLVSPAARHVTNQVLAVDAGFTLS